MAVAGIAIRTSSTATTTVSDAPGGGKHGQQHQNQNRVTNHFALLALRMSVPHPVLRRSGLWTLVPGLFQTHFQQFITQARPQFEFHVRAIDGRYDERREGFDQHSTEDWQRHGPGNVGTSARGH